ncbi:Phytochrome-like protein cph1 [Paracidovorax citrulli]|nr:Phytochrome-like protein cph1 [Paracidovorax citrulli]SDJ10773.1 His Kinase A (phospho-acceptor) domain-containing protein [Paracidovorax citrulli]
MTEERAGAACPSGPGPSPYEGLDAPALRALLAERDRALADMAAAHDEFLHAVSHDLRAPLRHIVSFGPLVRELVEDEAQGLPAGARAEACSFLGTMDQASRRMGRMLDGLLALSRIARAPLHRAPVDLNELLAGMPSALAGEAPGRRVEWRIAPGLPTVAGDAALLRQLFTELLGNALKFTRDRTPAIVEIEGDVAGDGSARLAVRDNGTGFDPARAGMLFGVFQRLHRDADFDGMGVGLAKARAIMQRHRGRIGIDAVPGEGCTVVLAWPPGAAGAPTP